MFWKKYDRQKVGAPIRAATLNDLQTAAETLGRLTGTSPIEVVQTPGGPVIRWSGPSPYLRYFLPTSGPIPAATGTSPNVTCGVGTATAYYRDPTSNKLTSWEYTADVVNWAPGAVGASNRFILCAFVDGDWTVVAEACPPSGA